MKRSMQGLGIILGSIIATIAVLAAAVAWGPHHCDVAFPAIAGCAIGSYESLAGGMVAAGAAIFAGWLAWSAVQVQIAAEEKRAAADRIEVEQVLQGDLDMFGEALGAIWRLLERLDQNESVDDQESFQQKLSGVSYGIEGITKETWLSSSRKMVTALGWRRRRDYEELFAGLERLGQVREGHFEVYEALDAVRSVSIDFEILRPATARYFEGLFRRAGRAETLGGLIERQAGVPLEERSFFDPAD